MKIIVSLFSLIVFLASCMFFTSTALADDVKTVERSIVGLSQSKQGLHSKVEKLNKEALKELKTCKNKGPAWTKIRKVKHGSQKSLYIKAARRYWNSMNDVIIDYQSNFSVYGNSMKRFLDSNQGVSDSVLRTVLDTHQKRYNFYESVSQIEVGCKVFNKVASRVKDFDTSSATRIIQSDYLASPLARRIEFNIKNQITKAQRKAGLSERDSDTFLRGYDRLVELGAHPGYANAFRYALVFPTR